MSHDDDVLSPRLTRRDAIRLLGGAGAAGLLLGATDALAARECLLTPQQTAGPFWLDARLRRRDLGAGSTRPGVTGGLRLNLRIEVLRYRRAGCVAARGAIVDVWHADAGGVYSGFASQGTAGQTFLRGYQRADADGVVRFRTIYPGWYPGRTAHFHVRVRDFDAGGNVTWNVATQGYFDDAISDSVYAGAPYNARGARSTRNAGDALFGPELLTASTPNGDGVGYTSRMTIGLVTG